MKILVTFYSKTGHTKRVSTDLAKNLKSDIDEIIDLKNRNGIWGWIKAGYDGFKGKLTEIKNQKNPGNYDLVLVGTPVWGDNLSPAVRTYITKYKNDLKKVVVFTASGGAKIEKTVAQIEAIIDGKKVLGFEGWDETDFKDENKYQDKLKRFLEKIKLVSSK
ncbi:MAG: flavodoxin domain-containing protein [Clostridia bacterium]|nr:flavodoxin domain-containing protein [Clostridia bacterium]